MEVREFNEVLAESLNIVDIGIDEGYFEEDKKEELNEKLLVMFNKGIIYDIEGTAIYGMYLPDEKKLCFNIKVFKSKEEALVYVLHEIKHGLDHCDDIIGFENNGKFVGANEGATQRFATDMAEKMLGITFPREAKSSLGISFNTHLDEYQIENKLNELFCLTMNISMVDFIRMQNDPKKEEFNKLIDEFNKHASFEVFNNSLDGIYHIQEETWYDEKGDILENEKEPTADQTRRALKLVNLCKKELIKYAEKENRPAVSKIREESFMTINKYGEIVRSELEEVKESKAELMTDEQLYYEDLYLNYQNEIIDKIDSDLLTSECNIVFVTEFRYEHENADKIIYFRKGDFYQKIIIPMNEDMTMDIKNISVQNATIDEILDEIKDYEEDFGIIANAEEYAKLLSKTGQAEKAKNILKKWKYYLSKQNELDRIKKDIKKSGDALDSFMANIRESIKNDSDVQAQNDYFDDLFKQEIRYKNIVVQEDLVFILEPEGYVRFCDKDKEKECIREIQEAVENGEIILNRVQQSLLESHIQKKL